MRSGWRGLFQREQPSLFGEILDWMLTPLLLLWPLSLGLTWFVAQGIANRPYDRALEFTLQALTPFVTEEHGRVTFALTPQARELLRADDTDLVFYQVRDAAGRLVAGDPAFPAPAQERAVPPGVVRLRDDVVHDEEVRVAYVWLALGGTEPRALVQVGETRGKRSKLATEIVKGVMVPQFIILPLAVLLVWVALVHGIRPLSELERRIRSRRPDDLSPIDQDQVPQEVAPLVGSINDLLQRLATTLSNQKRFLADAAHQLKTPLAGLRLQAEMALKQLPAGSGEDIERTLRQIASSSVRATHTVNQLLALARAEAAGQALPREPVDLTAVAREVVEDLVPLALDKGIDLGFETLPPPATLRGAPTLRLWGNAVLLAELVRNLADNALRYTPNGGIVTVRVLSDPWGGVQVLQIEDDGPGIAPQERERVLAPFYRTLGTNVDGSGLGLAIVHEIVRQHGATLTMEDTHPQRTERRGLRVAVRFQAAAGW